MENIMIVTMFENKLIFADVTRKQEKLIEDVCYKEEVFLNRLIDGRIELCCDVHNMWRVLYELTKVNIIMYLE